MWETEGFIRELNYKEAIKTMHRSDRFSDAAREAYNRMPYDMEDHRYDDPEEDDLR